MTDLHIQTNGEQLSADALPVEEYDAVVSLGDVIDENREHAKSVQAGERYERRGRAFFESLNDHGTPVVAVPGNHDPLDCTRRLTDGLENVTLLHEDATRVGSGDGTGGCSIVGWGCEQFDFTSAHLAPDYPDIDVGSGTTATPDTIADTLLGHAGRYLGGVDDADDLAANLGIDGREATRQFESSLSMLEERFETLTAVVQAASGPGSGPVLVASHVSPFHVPFDRRDKHSHDGDYHTGSLALRLALAATGPVACLSGHTHTYGFTAIETTAGHSYAFNPGEGGVASVTVDDTGSVQTESLDIG
ncbi:metallophosphoesterase family protein [Haloarchaeobius amylolyticus]|uniref:metallophosphoesterase family protein n=1 Tax=Haloarchaeobius amylolyticus TaxID=1198296 RepID=UPI00226F7FB7|nr:metallophosphoesterase [Haloarchaeobius amylolyticus]